MVLFKEIYKAANDDIKADEELLNKVLKNKRRKRMPVYRYSAIAASVAVIAVAIAAAPSMLYRNREDGAFAPAAATDEPKAVSTAAPVLEAASEAEAAADTVREMPQEKQKKTQAEKPTASIKEASVAKSETKNSEPVAEKQTDLIREDTSDITAEAESAVSVMPMMAKKVNTSVRTVVLNVNDIDYSVAADRGGYEYDDEIVSGGAYTPAQWTMNDYFEYLGEDVMAKVSLPSDFSYIGDDKIEVSLDENGAPMQDSVIFPYEGGDGRYVTVMTSKQTLTAQTYLEDERYAKSDINGSDAVVIGGEESYKSYMMSGEVSYTVTSDGITEDELGETLVSIGG